MAVGGGGSPSHGDFCSALMQTVEGGVHLHMRISVLLSCRWLDGRWIGMQIAHPGCPFSQLPSAQKDLYASVTHFRVVYKARRA